MAFSQKGEKNYLLYNYYCYWRGYYGSRGICHIQLRSSSGRAININLIKENNLSKVAKFFKALSKDELLAYNAYFNGKVIGIELHDQYRRFQYFFGGVHVQRPCIFEHFFRLHIHIHSELIIRFAYGWFDQACILRERYLVHQFIHVDQP